MMFKKKEFAETADKATARAAGTANSAPGTAGNTEAVPATTATGNAEAMVGTNNAGGYNAPTSDELIAQWQKDAENLALIVTDFSLNEAVKNPEFAKALKSGKSVFAAYAAAMGGGAVAGNGNGLADGTAVADNGNGNGAAVAGKREEIHQNARSPRRGTGGSTVNPAKLSAAEFRKYIESIKDR